jgi:septal ring factor EnvC (AmiA/AmiB activator)
METMTDTPETDGEWNRLACQDHSEFERNLADFARKLERELAEARRAIEGLGSVLSKASAAYDAITEQRDRLAQERDELRAQLQEEQQLHVQTLNERDEARDQRDRLAESLNRACANPTTGNWYREAEDALAAWTKNKP